MDIEKLGRYDIIAVLGKGAMGVVYEGRDPNLDRRVAIKTIRVQNLSVEAAAEYEGRFRTEARSVARLHHPNIVSVFDSGQDGQIAYLVMEFVAGEDLKHHLECGQRFTPRAAVGMVHDLLMALDHAHRQNVVHRDVKPANLLIEEGGRVKLTDFGVARIQDPDEASLTQVGGAVGTPKYMSPEQARGQRGDSRSDVFSAGVVLYELLTGRLPFDGDNQFVVIHQITNHEPAAPSSLCPQLPVAVDEVITRALAKSPEARYATAREFALALRALAPQLVSIGVSDAPNNLGPAGADGQSAHDPALRDGSSTGIFGPVDDVALASTISHDEELAGWSRARDSNDVAALREFLLRFPTGVYSRRARQQLDRLDTAASDPDATLPGLVPPASQAPVVPVAAAKPTNPTAPVVAPDGPTAPTGKGKWVMAGLVGLACVAGLGALVMSLRTSDPGLAPSQVASEAVVAMAGAASAPSGASAGASAPASAASQAASKPALAASHPTHAVVVPRHVASAPVKPASVAPPPEPAKVAARASAPLAPTSKPVPGASTPGAVGEKGSGPSAPGNICAERVFVFRIACVAEACTTDKFRASAECVEFKAMERARDEQRNSQR